MARQGHTLQEICLFRSMMALRYLSPRIHLDIRLGTKAIMFNYFGSMTTSTSDRSTGFPSGPKISRFSFMTMPSASFKASISSSVNSFANSTASGE